MHVRKGVWASILVAFILGTFALPLAGLTLTPATPAAAASSGTGVAAGPGGTATAFMASSGTAVAFNLLGSPDTAIFQCGPTASVGGGTAANTTGVAPGCYDVIGSVSTEFTGAGAGVVGGSCGDQTATASGSAINCAGVASPLCPSDTTALNNPGNCGGANCATTFTAGCSQAKVTINPNSPEAFSITFTYWVPFVGTAAQCTAAGGLNFASTATASEAEPPDQFTVTAGAGSGFCQFSVTVEKKYIEITSLTLTPVGTCATTSPLLFAEGLKQFFGAPCTFHVAAAGIVNIKPEPATGCPTGSPGAPFPSGSKFVCENGVLSVLIPDVSAVLAAGVGVPITVTGTGVTVGLTTTGATLNSLCGGTTGTVTSTSTNFVVCPTGPGVASITACLNPAGFPDTQPTPICSAPFHITFTLPGAARVVPYVRWAGEKQVLTKCFGGALHNAGALVEFTLASGGSDSAQATLIPAAIGGTVGTVGPSGGGASVGQPSQNTVFTTTDANGCATVILFAAGEGQVNVDASLFATTPAAGTTVGVPLINEHVFTVFYLKFDHVDIENVKLTTYSSATLTSPVNSLGFTASGATALPATFPGAFASPAASFVLPNPPGSNPQPAGGYPVPLCGIDYVRALVHGYFEIPGDPSGRPASTVAIPGAPSNAASSYVLPAGRWVLPEDWPVLATFAGFVSGAPVDNPVSSVFAWDLNSGWVFNPGGERADLCEGPTLPTDASGAVTATPPDVGANTVGSIDNTFPTFNAASGVTSYTGSVSYGPCYGIDASPTAYSTAPAGPNCAAGVTVGIGPFDATQACTNPYPIDFSPSGSSVLCDNVVTPCPTGTPLSTSPGAVAVVPLGPNSTFLPNGTLNEWDAPMPPAQVTFNITGGPGFLDQVNKTGLYAIPTVNSAGATTPTAIYPDPFYAEAIPASPLIPPILNNGGYLWDTWGFRGGTTLAPTVGAGAVAGTASVANPFVPVGSLCPAPFTSVTSGTTTACFVGTAGSGTASTSVTAAECASVGGTFTAVDTTVTPATGTCHITTLPTAATVSAGTTTSFVGSTCPTSVAGVAVTNAAGLPISTSVDVADASAFAVGDTITLAGQTLTISAIDTVHNTLTFSTPVTGCITPGSASAIGNTVTVTLASPPPAGTVTAGTNIELTTTTASVSTTVVSVNGATITLSNAAAIAQALAGCTLGTAGCTVIIPAGTLLTTGATGGQAPVLCAPGQTATVTPGTTDAAGDVNTAATTSCAATPGAQGPYPFWQFVPNASTGSTTNPSATVYSDNHGEAIVSLETGIATTVAPVNGACPAGYSPAPTAAAPTTCLLNLGALGVASTSPNGVAFPNVAAALAAFSSSTPGCIQTSSSGAVVTPTATATSTTPQPAVGATGPLPGQICVNKLGGVEFGAGATLGTTTLQAIADYPYVRGVHPPISSGTITKVFTSMFAKTVTVTPLSATTGCTPGTTGCGIPGPAGTTEFNVVITATDICGNPIAGEPVNVFTLGNDGAVVLGALGSDAVQHGTNAATVVTGANGTATLSLEVLNSAIKNEGLVIKAVFPLERLERFVTVVPGTSGATATVLYTPGYNMVGGPAGSNFSSVEALFNFVPATNSYGNATASAANISSAPPTCTGYFAYFAAATAVNLPVSGTPGQTAACTLGAGWNLVGNPFSTPANIQAGVTAYYWNPTSQSYVTVSQIPTGGAVFIFNDGTLNTVTLTAT